MKKSSFKWFNNKSMQFVPKTPGNNLVGIKVLSEHKLFLWLHTRTIRNVLREMSKIIFIIAPILKSMQNQNFSTVGTFKFLKSIFYWIVEWNKWLVWTQITYWPELCGYSKYIVMMIRASWFLSCFVFQRMMISFMCIVR